MRIKTTDLENIFNQIKDMYNNNDYIDYSDEELNMFLTYCKLSDIKPQNIIKLLLSVIDNNNVNNLLSDLNNETDINMQSKQGKIIKDQIVELEYYKAKAEESEQLKNNIIKKDEELLKLRKESDINKEALKNINKHWLQREQIKAGKKLHYNEDASCARVKALKESGKNITEIAKILGVSRGVVYRRLNELKNL